MALRPFKRSLTPALSPGLQMEMPNWDWAGESAGLRSSLSQFASMVGERGRQLRPGDKIENTWTANKAGQSMVREYAHIGGGVVSQ